MEMSTVWRMRCKCYFQHYYQYQYCYNNNMEKEGTISTSLVLDSKYLKFQSYSSSPSSYRFIEDNELDFCDVAGLKMKQLKRYYAVCNSDISLLSENWQHIPLGIFESHIYNCALITVVALYGFYIKKRIFIICIASQIFFYSVFISGYYLKWLLCIIHMDNLSQQDKLCRTEKHEEAMKPYEEGMVTSSIACPLHRYTSFLTNFI